MSTPKTQLERLSIQNFRNVSELLIEPHERFNIISGHNGMGKTNLLEAIYMLGSLRSFRTSLRSEVIKHDESLARISAKFGGAVSGLKCDIAISRGARAVKIDGKQVTVRADHFRTLPMVLFHPAQMSLIKGGPDERRRFLDRALFQSNVSYPDLHRDYAKALATRNLLLKSNRGSASDLEPFDVPISQLASVIVQSRLEIIEALAPHFVDSARVITGGIEATLRYRPSFSGAAHEFLEKLREKRPYDLHRGFTTVGPQADDIEILIDGRSSKKFASQGQKRALVLALKIAETKVLTDHTGRIPLMLLDDISSELDREKNKYLFDFLAGVGGQVFITTTHLDHILIEDARRDFTVENGSLQG